jgi:hypothetical protein
MEGHEESNAHRLPIPEVDPPQYGVYAVFADVTGFSFTAVPSRICLLVGNVLL